MGNFSLTSILVLGAVSIVCLCVIYLCWEDIRNFKLFQRRGRDNNASTPYKDENIARSPAYLKHCFDVYRRFDSINSHTPPSQEVLQAIGDMGEMTALQQLEKAGACIAFWNVGINIEGKKTEIDILAITAFGVLHVEVKNLRGTWVPAKGQNIMRPARWAKVNAAGDVLNEIRSPFCQAERASEILQEALSSCVGGAPVPVITCIYFADTHFNPQGIEDDRFQAWITPYNAEAEFTAIVQGRWFKDKMAPDFAARIATSLRDVGLEPVFFDENFYKGVQYVFERYAQ